MSTKGKIVLIILSLVFWGLIIGDAFLSIMPMIKDDQQIIATLDNVDLIFWIQYSFSLLTLLLFFMAISLFKFFWVTILYFGAVVTIKKFFKEKLDITDKKTDHYYRDLLKKYSVGVLGYIRDFQVSDALIAATILSLELKGKISIADNIIVTDSSIENLDSNEAYILESISSNNKNDINVFVYKNKVTEDCLKNDLLTTKGDFKRKRNRKIIIFIFLMFLFYFNANFMPDIFNKYISGKAPMLENIVVILIFIGLIMMFIVPGIYIVRLIIYTAMSRLDPYVRNKSAKELNNKLNGLENFLKDFSIIHERDRKELKLWEEYLIYSIIFGQNNDIKNDIITKLNLD